MFNMSDGENQSNVTYRDNEPPNQTDSDIHVEFSPEDSLSLFSRKQDSVFG